MSRNINKEIDEFQKKINGYTPGSTFRVHRERPNDLPDVLRIGLFGPPGVGKSALVNSMNFAAMDNVPGSTWMSIAAEGYTHYTAQTVTREASLIAKNIKIVDNRGMIGLGSPYMVKLGYQLAGVYSDRRQNVEWEVGFIRTLSSWLEIAIRASKHSEIHCTVLVFSARDLSVRASHLTKLHAKIKEMTGYPPIVIITHRYHPDVKEKVLSEFRTDLQRLGIDYVFELENYTRDNHQYDSEKHVVLLEALQQCTIVGDRVMKYKEDNKRGCLIL